MKSDIKEIIQLLEKEYGKLTCPLIHNSAWQLLLATILSAQCKDEMVNKVTTKLFDKYPTIDDINMIDVEVLMKLIYSTGFYRNKAKNIKAAAKYLIENKNSQIPDSIDELIKIPGVARKTANVVLSEWYKKDDGIIVDTHVKRLANRLGLIISENPEKIEFKLMEITEKSKWGILSSLLKEHGRVICDAKKPKCENCVLKDSCGYYQKLNTGKGKI
jgi:endonuclease-3